MRNILLIPEPKIFDDSTQLPFEQTYPFLLQSTMPGMDVVRQFLNEWAAKYSEEDISAIKARLSAEFDSCFFEMLIHELFIRQGYTIQHHPELGSHTTKRPDFLAIRGSYKLYLEAMVINSQSDTQKARENLVNQIYCTLGQFDCGPYLYLIEQLKVSGNGSPSLRPLKYSLKRFVSKHQQLQECHGEDSNSEEILDFSYKDDHISLEMGLLPFSENIVGDRVGFRLDSFWGDHVEPIRKAVKYKGNKYGKHFEAPYIIALNVIGRRYLDKFDVLEALYGTLEGETSLSPCVQTSHRKPNGVFKLLPQVSAVMVGQINLYNLDHAEYRFYHNPYATFPIDLGEYLPQRIIKGDHDNFLVEGSPLSKILEVSEKYGK